MAGEQLVTTHLCPLKLQEAFGGLFPSLSRGLCWEPRFLEAFANRDGKWQQHGGQCIRGWFCPAEHLPLEVYTVGIGGLAQNLQCLELEQWEAQEHEPRVGMGAELT